MEFNDFFIVRSSKIISQLLLAVNQSFKRRVQHLKTGQWVKVINCTVRKICIRFNVQVCEADNALSLLKFNIHWFSKFNTHVDKTALMKSVSAWNSSNFGK